MTPLTPLLPRLRPLIGKLGSMHDGEIVAAARAMGRLLERQGLTFNDVAAALDGGPGARFEFTREPVPPQTPSEMVDWLTSRRSRLAERERALIDSLAPHTWRGPGFRLSPKQRAWLGDIFAREWHAEARR